MSKPCKRLHLDSTHQRTLHNQCHRNWFPCNSQWICILHTAHNWRRNPRSKCCSRLLHTFGTLYQIDSDSWCTTDLVRRSPHCMTCIQICRHISRNWCRRSLRSFCKSHFQWKILRYSLSLQMRTFLVEYWYQWWCRQPWRLWIDHHISQYSLNQGVALGFDSNSERSWGRELHTSPDRSSHRLRSECIGRSLLASGPNRCCRGQDSLVGACARIAPEPSKSDQRLSCAQMKQRDGPIQHRSQQAWIWTARRVLSMMQSLDVQTRSLSRNSWDPCFQLHPRHQSLRICVVMRLLGLIFRLHPRCHRDLPQRHGPDLCLPASWLSSP